MAAEHQFPGWDVLEKLGEGGMCVVYRARSLNDPTIERAIKVMVADYGDAVARFKAEAQLLISLDHPNILRVHELVDASPPWIVMDLLAGKDLSNQRDLDGKTSPLNAARWIADVAQGLQQAHDLGIVHRDIKPDNIVLGHDGIPRLIDFGVARSTGEAHRTAAGIVVGTAAYLPPELFLDADPKRLQDNPAADVYALGQTLCELLIDRHVHPPDAHQGPQMLVQIMRDKISRPHLDPREWVSHVPDDLAQIVIQATHQLPEQRIPTATALEAQLRDWIARRRDAPSAPVSPAGEGSFPIPQKPDTPAPAPRRSPPVKEALGLGAVGLSLTLVAIAVVAVGGIGVVLAMQSDPEADAAIATLQDQFREDVGAIRACSSQPVELRIRAIRDLDGERIEVDGGSSSVNRCIRRVVRRWDLPESDAPVDVSIPVRLR